MTLKEEKESVIKELENILIADDKAKKKAKALLWVVDCHGREVFLQALKEIEDRK